MATRKNTLGTTLLELQKAEAHLQQLRSKAAEERRERLKDLHLALGFASRTELVDALQELNGSRRRASVGAARATAMRGGTRRRARITTELRADVVRAVKANEVGASIAKRFGISIQSVQNIKKAAGLVRARGA